MNGWMGSYGKNCDLTHCPMGYVDNLTLASATIYLGHFIMTLSLTIYGNPATMQELFLDSGYPHDKLHNLLSIF